MPASQHHPSWFPPRAFFLAPALSLVLLGACSSDREEPENLVVEATRGDAFGYRDPLSFAVGLQSEIGVRGRFGMPQEITQARCADGSCRVERDVSRLTNGRYATMLVTPLAPTFRIHLDVNANAGPTSIDKELTAVDGEMGALHRAAGPGVPFIAGTSITWYIGPKNNNNVAWDASQSVVSVTPPFELVSKPEVGEGPDRKMFVGVQIRATAKGTGTLTHMNGDATTTFPLVAVGHDEIAKLHIATAPNEGAGMMIDSEPLSSLKTNVTSIGSYTPEKMWIVFETKSGAFGVAGAGESLPSPGASFDVLPYQEPFYAFGLSKKDKPLTPPTDQPFLTLKGQRLGTSQLLLRVGDLTGSADVTVHGQ